MRGRPEIGGKAIAKKPGVAYVAYSLLHLAVMAGDLADFCYGAGGGRLIELIVVRLVLCCIEVWLASYLLSRTLRQGRMTRFTVPKLIWAFAFTPPMLLAFPEDAFVWLSLLSFLVWALVVWRIDQAARKGKGPKVNNFGINSDEREGVNGR